MASWGGFSDEDLFKMKNELVPDENKIKENNKIVPPKFKKGTFQTSKKSALREKIPVRQNTGGISSVLDQEGMPPSQNLKPLMNDNNFSLGNMTSKCEDKLDLFLDQSSDMKPTSNECLEPVGFKFNMSNLEQFQVRQKIMEEQNAKKKDMLMKAIANKWKKTQGEAAKLAEIQKSLAHLDGILSNDVSILRNKIEDASREYMEAQKRYNKVEKEFIEAKLELQKKTERKDQLMEHLCTIIEQNEIRKAKKLAELMEKLEMETSVEELQQLDNLPQIGILNAHFFPPLKLSPKVSNISIASNGSLPSTSQSTSVIVPTAEITNQTIVLDKNYKHDGIETLAIKYPSDKKLPEFIEALIEKS